MVVLPEIPDGYALLSALELVATITFSFIAGAVVSFVVTT